MQFEPPRDIVKKIEQVAQNRARVLVAIAGPPGAGKSTIADALAASLRDAAVLPMDGFHLDNDTLRELGLLHRKGAPQTFDTAGLHALLAKIQKGGAVSVPTFDREADCVIPDGGQISADTHIVLVEGNYLLLDAPGWADLQGFWDLTVAIEVPLEELEQRLVQRWLDHGLSKADAINRAHENDLRNARLVTEQSVMADVTFRQKSDDI